MTPNLSIAGINLEPGTRRRHRMSLVELADGTEVSIPLDIIHGGQPGPVLYLGAAIHGDEVNGVGILFRALEDINPVELCGSVVAVPVQHPAGGHHSGNLQHGHGRYSF